VDRPLAVLVFLRHEHDAKACPLAENLVEEHRQILPPKVLGVEVVIEHGEPGHPPSRSHADKLTDDGRQPLVRHGYLPEREIMTGIGPLAVRCPRVGDRDGQGPEAGP
jgi:hypothetical protein